MLKLFTIFLSFIPVLLQAQLSFKTVVPQQPIVAGESFQLQYILEGGDNSFNIRAPLFQGFRLITGPNIYSGSFMTAAGLRPVQNFVYTLEAIRPGKFTIPGSIVTANNKTVKSEQVTIEVISEQDAVRMLARRSEMFNDDYFLRPGEDPYKKIRENLFVKVHVDRKNCFTGEPVLATFKLYSRLESKSDIIKNPGFYGFTVHDMVSLSDKQVSTEKLNGMLFDVHTIRKVQLYPLRAGEFSIDPMEVRNRVEFSRSRVNKKTEQEIAEGMMREENEPPPAGTDIYETHTRTSPVLIHVKDWPEINKPALFAGATGQFRIHAKLVNNELAKNEEGFLEITISGKGNFIQLNAPEIKWPAGMEGFEPSVKDVLDKTQVPIQGQRIFRFPFACAVPGQYVISPVSFSFFDPDSNRYRTVGTNQLSVTIKNERKKAVIAVEKRPGQIKQNDSVSWVAAGIALLAVLFVILFWTFNKKDKITGNRDLPPEKTSVIDELLQPLYGLKGDNREFYTALSAAIWSFVGTHFHLTGSAMHKEGLRRRMESKGVSQETANALMQLLEKCEAGVFTTAVFEDEREKEIMQAKRIFEGIETGLL